MVLASCRLIRGFGLLFYHDIAWDRMHRVSRSSPDGLDDKGIWAVRKSRVGVVVTGINVGPLALRRQRPAVGLRGLDRAAVVRSVLCRVGGEVDDGDCRLGRGLLRVLDRGITGIGVRAPDDGARSKVVNYGGV